MYSFLSTTEFPGKIWDIFLLFLVSVWFDFHFHIRNWRKVVNSEEWRKGNFWGRFFVPLFGSHWVWVKFCDDETVRNEWMKRKGNWMIIVHQDMIMACHSFRIAAIGKFEEEFWINFQFIYEMKLTFSGNEWINKW